MAIEYFCCYHSYQKKFARLSDEQFGRVIRALLEYSETGKCTKKLDQIEGMAFDMASFDIDNAQSEYAEKCRKRKASAEKRWGKQEENQDANGARKIESMQLHDLHKETCNCMESKTKTKTKTKDNTPHSPPDGDAFDAFWKSYPKKVGKQAARKAFEQVQKTRIPLETLLTAIERQKRSDQWSRDNGRFIPNPTTWLNQGRWDDEIPDMAGGENNANPGKDRGNAPRAWNLPSSIGGDEPSGN